MATVTFNFEINDSSSLTTAIAELMNYQRKLQIAGEKAAERLADIAVSVANKNFSNAVFFGNDDYSVSKVRTQYGWSVVASGEDIFFLEFGAGTTTERDSFANDSGVAVAPGSWSDTHKRMFSNHGFWYYKGLKIYGTGASHAMQKAYNAVLANAVSILNEEVDKIK